MMIEETDQDNVKDNVVGDGKESSSSLQPEAEESERNEGDACEQRKHNMYSH